MSRRQVIFEWACLQSKPFHSGTIAKEFGLSPNNAGREVLVMADQECLIPVGKERHATLYKANPNKRPIGRGQFVRRPKRAVVPTFKSPRRWTYVSIERLPLVTL